MAYAVLETVSSAGAWTMAGVGREMGSGALGERWEAAAARVEVGWGTAIAEVVVSDYYFLAFILAIVAATTDS